MTEEGYKFPIDVNSRKWAIEQAITNRSSDTSMMQAAIEYVETVEYREESFNGFV